MNGYFLGTFEQDTTLISISKMLHQSK